MRPIAATVTVLCALNAMAQLDSIMDQGAYRTFIVHLPAGYMAGGAHPLVLNLHGYNSDAAQQQAYSGFDQQADAHGFIVAYPNAAGGSWSIPGTTDVTFLGNLVDTLRARYAVNDCLFLTGMSMGGFMTYKMACASPLPITAIAVVAGNMAMALQNTCTAPLGLPVMHLHGTDDAIVSYTGTVGIPPVETTVQWWATRNGCGAPQVTALPNTVPTDGCTVDRLLYPNGSNGSEVDFYRINGGGHTWPGAVPVPPLGNTNEDINASASIADFFQQYCGMPAPVVGTPPGGTFGLYPNPAGTNLMLRTTANEPVVDVRVMDMQGRIVMSGRPEGNTIDVGAWPPGLYTVELRTAGGALSKSVLVER